MLPPLFLHSAPVLPSFCLRSTSVPKGLAEDWRKIFNTPPLFRPRNVNRILTQEKTRCYKAVVTESVEMITFAIGVSIRLRR